MGKALELTGKTFNKWTVLKRVKNGPQRQSMWLCKCECGNLVTIRGYSLATDRTKSCGCLFAIDLTGKSFGRWTVIEQAGKNIRAGWLCRCECGLVKTVDGSSLRSGSSKSCGCSRKSTVSKKGKSKTCGHSTRLSNEEVLKLIGKKFGRWTIIKLAGKNNHRERLVVCRCDCGTEKVKTCPSLNSGATKSCGCLAADLCSSHGINITGKVFNMLTVIKKHKKRSYEGWICKCECGGEIIVTYANLKRGGVKSCGCLKKLPHGQAAFNDYFYHYKIQAEKRGLEWELDKNVFKVITSSDCEYCGYPPHMVHDNHGSANGNYISNGVDRVDSLKGYTIDNCVPCCKICNIAKRKMNIDEFKTFLKQWVISAHKHFTKE